MFMDKKTLTIVRASLVVQRSLAGYSLWGHKESDTTEWLTLSLSGIITLKFIRASEECMKQYTNLAHHHFYQSLVKYMNLRTTVVKFSSWLLQQSTAAAPYLGQGVSPHHCPSWPSTWDSSSKALLRPCSHGSWEVGLVFPAATPGLGRVGLQNHCRWWLQPRN